LRIESLDMSTKIKSKAPGETASLWEIPPIRIPSSAGTHAGFRAWVTSDEFPEELCVSFINQEIVIDWDFSLFYIPASATTHAGFRAWATSDEFPEKLRASYINQEIVIDMSPEELETHNKVKGEIYCALRNLVRDFDLGELYFDRTLVTNPDTGLSIEPDGTFVTWASFEADRVRLIPRKYRSWQYVELEGTPDWILEVVSQSSVRKDTKSLRDLYHRSGIPEYWLIDARFDEVSFQILRRRRDRYIAVKPHDGWHRSTVFGRSFRLERRKNRLGRWRYTLDVLPA
jgi:Uma2 family endonuclease